MRLAAAIVACLPLFTAAQRPLPHIPQPAPLPQYVPSVPEKDVATRNAEQKLQAAYVEYQKCVADHPKQTELYLATSRVVQARSNKTKTEYELATSPALRARWPGDYEQILDSAFKDYREAGGSAQTVEAVAPMDDPCSGPEGRAVGKP